MAYEGTSSRKILWLLVAFGAIASFSGPFVFLLLTDVGGWFVLRRNHDPNLPFSWSLLAPKPWWLHAIVSGALSTGLLAPWFIRCISRARSRYVLWGAFLGILAAVLNTVILTLVSIATFSYRDGSFEASIADWIIQRIFPTILLIGIPPTILGAAVGICAAKYFRKALLAKNETSSKIVSTASR
jgi:hypothetical protein